MDPESFDLAYLSRLARLSLEPAEREQFSRQLGDILAYVERLQGVEVAGIEPMAHGNPVFNVMDPDEPTEPMDCGAFLANAPATSDNQILVPRVIE